MIRKHTDLKAKERLFLSGRLSKERWVKYKNYIDLAETGSFVSDPAKVYWSSMFPKKEGPIIFIRTPSSWY